LVGVEGNLHGGAVAGLGGGSHAGGHLVALVVQVQVDLGAHQLRNFHGGGQGAVLVSSQEVGIVLDVLGTDAGLHSLANVLVQLGGDLLGGQGDLVAGDVNHIVAAVLLQLGIQE